jgi:hypothetical protein
METPKNTLKHQWVPINTLLESDTATYPVCKRCGYVQNDKNKDAPCKPRKGKGGIAGILRETKKSKA